ncbi:adenylyltransferase/cytidyltransferase family protein [Candidatus Woesearchaeota archaeon]|nr:adenylyltransferase/cytidyltransferase family protein [Candidatus Woesearchaeota archaeon]
MKVMVFGTFDIIHPGHVHFLKTAKKHGKHLTIVLARSENVEKIKGKSPIFSNDTRMKNIKYLDIADKVMLGNKDDPYLVIENEKPDIICLGYDQESYTENLEGKLEKRGLNLKIKRLSSYKPEIFKSSKLRCMLQ